MCLLGSPEANDSAHRMAAHSMVEGASKSLAEEECARLYSDKARISREKGNIKMKEREKDSKLKLHKYHIQEAETAKFRDLKMVASGPTKKRKRAIMDCWHARTFA
jgi:hypothetical protein